MAWPRGLAHGLEEQRTGLFMEEYYEKLESKLIEEHLRPDFWNSAYYGIYGLSFKYFKGNDVDAVASKPGVAKEVLPLTRRILRLRLLKRGKLGEYDSLSHSRTEVRSHQTARD